MDNTVTGKFHRSNLFQKLILIIGVGVGLSGFWLINRAFAIDSSLSWGFLMTVALWLLLIFIMILTDSNESIKEELGTIIREHISETRLLKEEIVILQKITDRVSESNKNIKDELARIIKEHIDETKLLKQEVVMLQHITNDVKSGGKRMKVISQGINDDSRLLKKEVKMLGKLTKKKKSKKKK